MMYLDMGGAFTLPEFSEPPESWFGAWYYLEKGLVATTSTLGSIAFILLSSGVPSVCVLSFLLLFFFL